MNGKEWRLGTENPPACLLMQNKPQPLMQNVLKDLPSIGSIQIPAAIVPLETTPRAGSVLASTRGIIASKGVAPPPQPPHNPSKPQQNDARSVTSDDITSGHMAWNESIETMLAKWCDEAKCFEWMHMQAHSYFEKRARVVGISSAVLTALSGFANVILGSSTSNGFQLSWVFGGMSILVSIIGILQDKLAYSRRSAEHRQFSSQWSIIRRKIEEELSIPPESRRECVTFLKYIRQDINQVSVDGNTLLPSNIRTACFEAFKHVKDFDMPDICGDMEHTRVFERHAPDNNTPASI